MYSDYQKNLISNGFHPEPEPDKQDFPAYTPQFTLQISAAVRRLAWSLNKPMTQAIKLLVKALPAIINPEKVCQKCKDKSVCKSCIFSRQYTAEEKAALLAAL